jgi:integral membrane protein (TIGR00529 family)
VESIIATLNMIPAVLRVMVVFVLVLLAIKCKWSLGNTFLGATVALGLVFGMPPAAILRSVGVSLIHPKTLSLSIVVSLILVLSHSLEKAGQMGRLLDGFKGLIRRPQVNMVIFPALIGLLPMPGGAIFSAPMVKNLGQTHGLSAPQLSYINYWYRHIWEYWWPLYPGILLTTAMASIDLWRLVFVTLPLTLVVVLAGYWPLRGAMAAPRAGTGRTAAGPFLKELAPILFVIVFGLAVGQLFSVRFSGALQSVAKELGLILALLLAIVWVWRRNHMDSGQCWGIVRQPAMLNMIYMVAAILLFKGILEDSGAVMQMSQEMLRWHFALVPIAIVLPFLVGMVAGITIAFVGATFPILISLIQSMGQANLILPYMMLALASGFAGVLLSPLHLCLQLSNSYFHASMGPVYRLMAVPLVALVGTAVIYFGVLRYLMG